MVRSVSRINTRSCALHGILDIWSFKALVLITGCITSALLMVQVRKQLRQSKTFLSLKGSPLPFFPFPLLQLATWFWTTPGTSSGVQQTLYEKIQLFPVANELNRLSKIRDESLCKVSCGEVQGREEVEGEQDLPFSAEINLGRLR